MSPNEKARDTEGRPYDAPAWSGDINTLNADQLHHRIEALGSHIGRLSTTYVAGDGWYANEEFVEAARPWIRQRLACLRRLDEVAEPVSSSSQAGLRSFGGGAR